MMSQSTDTTQVMPLADSPQAQVDPDATVTMPVVAPVAPAVPVVPPQPAFDPVRDRLMHLHRVLGRILSTASLPTPDRVDLHAYGNGIELLLHDEAGLDAWENLFSGVRTAQDRDSQWAPSGRQRYGEFLTGLDGVEVRVWSLTDLPAAEQPEPAPEPAVVVLDETPATETEPVAAAEPEPQHDPAPAPTPETPAEHPEAA